MAKCKNISLVLLKSKAGTRFSKGCPGLTGPEGGVLKCRFGTPPTDPQPAINQSGWHPGPRVFNKALAFQVQTMVSQADGLESPRRRAQGGPQGVGRWAGIRAGPGPPLDSPPDGGRDGGAA